MNGAAMVTLKHSEMRVFDDAFDMHGGYVLNFSDRTMSEFFDDEFGINIYDEKYRFNGSSKAKHLRAFIATVDAFTVACVQTALGTSKVHSSVSAGSERFTAEVMLLCPH